MSYYKSKHFFQNDSETIQNFSFPLKPTVQTYEKYTPLVNKKAPLITEDFPVKKDSPVLPITEASPLKQEKASSNPNFWGSKLWHCLHLGAANYPEKPSPIAKQKMKEFISGLPYILPCENCFGHAVDYIEQNKNNLDTICDSKDNLFKFFHKFHNDVNKRIGKPHCTMEEAKNKFCN